MYMKKKRSMVRFSRKLALICTDIIEKKILCLDGLDDWWIQELSSLQVIDCTIWTHGKRECTPANGHLKRTVY